MTHVIEVQAHVKFVSSLILEPRHVSIVARSGVAVVSPDTSPTYWRPRSPLLTKSKHVEDGMPCLQLARRRVRVTLRNEDPKHSISYTSVSSHLNLGHHNVICDDGGEMWQRRLRIRLEPAHGTVEPNKHTHVDLILERENSDVNEIEDDDMSTEDDDDDENDREYGEENTLEGLLVIRTQTLSLRLRVSIEIRRNSFSPLSSPILNLKKSNDQNKIVVTKQTKQEDLEVKLEQALKRIQYLEALLSSHDVTGEENTLQRRLRAVAEERGSGDLQDDEEEWE